MVAMRSTIFKDNVDVRGLVGTLPHRVHLRRLPGIGAGVGEVALAHRFQALHVLELDNLDGVHQVLSQVYGAIALDEYLFAVGDIDGDLAALAHDGVSAHGYEPA